MGVMAWWLWDSTLEIRTLNKKAPHSDPPKSQLGILCWFWHESWGISWGPWESTVTLVTAGELFIYLFFSTEGTLSSGWACPGIAVWVGVRKRIQKRKIYWHFSGIFIIFLKSQLMPFYCLEAKLSLWPVIKNSNDGIIWVRGQAALVLPAEPPAPCSSLHCLPHTGYGDGGFEFWD